MEPLQPKVRFLVLLLAMVFLVATFHFCADLASTQSGTHLCPVCSTTVSLVSQAALIIIFVPVQNPIAVPASATIINVALPPSISPRAPPPSL